jgi:hypothetical protein
MNFLHGKKLKYRGLGGAYHKLPSLKNYRSVLALIPSFVVKT